MNIGLGKSEASLPGPASELLKRAMNNSRKEVFPAELMTFALTLNFYSPKAYNYVRDKFNASLPHPSTLRRRCSTVKVSTGFTYEILPTLQRIAREKHPATVLGALSMDEMAIRRHVEWDGKGFSGYIDYGTGLDSDDLPVAKEALTFMLTAVNGQWKLPVGYFFIKGLDATERANLVRQALDFLKESGVMVVSLTFDGTSCNFAMAAALGVNLKVGGLRTHFLYDDRRIYVLLDPSHMLKLVRNALASERYFIDGEGGLGGNCVPQDGTTLLSVAGNSTVNPHIPKTRLPEPLREEVDQGPPEDHTYSLISKSTTVSAYVDDVVGYIAGYVQRKLLKEVKCEECAQAVRESHGEGAASILIKMRTNGGLHVPSKDLTTVCQLAEVVFRRFQANGQLTARVAMDRMQSHSLREISERKSGVFCSLNDHALDQTPFDSHRILFISVKTSLQIPARVGV
ncbi:hypothetical protein J437_LFUL006055, partial [Ladona fulva]